MASSTTTKDAAAPSAAIGLNWYFVLLAAVLGIVGFVLFRTSSGPPVGEAGGFKNVLLITLDTTRADRIGCYGYSKAQTPNIDNMARRGVLFERCISVAPITLPSHASILTGIYPFRHGARNNGTHYLPEEVPTLAEALSEAGFATGAVVSALVLDSRYGLDQGFDAYDDDLANAEKAPLFMFRETKAADTAQRAIRWLIDRAGERWFLWVHFFDPHANYNPPEVFAAKCPDSPYDGEIAYADAGIGEILESLRQRDVLKDTLVAVTADHGESLGEHGESTHSMFIYDATTRVPLVFMHPSLATRKRVPTVVSSVDIVPTVLELMDVEGEDGLDGHSLADAMLHRTLEPESNGAYSEAMSPWYNHGWSDLRGIRDDRGRFIRAPRPELYDLFRDGRELDNLYPDYPERAEPYEEGLADLLDVQEADVRGDDIRRMDPEMRESLAALGYVWTSTEGEETIPAADRADPKDKVQVWERSQQANNLLRAERFDEAESALREVLAEDPGSVLSRSALSGVLIQQERYEEARELLLETVILPGARNQTWLRLAGLERDMGLADWRERLERAKELDPRDPLPWVREGDWAQDDGDADGAIHAYKQALELDERCAKAWVGIGNTEHRRGNEAEAEDALRRAITADPINLEAWYNLGVVAEAVNRTADAVQFYEKALEMESDHVLTLVNLGNIFLKANQAARAEELYLEALGHEPDDFNGNFNLGLHYLRSGRHREAAQAFGRAGLTDPERPEPWRNGMVANRAAGDLGAALECARRLLPITPDDMNGLMTRAALAFELGHDDEWRAPLMRALELDKTRVDARAERDPLVRKVVDALNSNGQ